MPAIERVDVAATETSRTAAVGRGTEHGSVPATHCAASGSSGTASSGSCSPCPCPCPSLCPCPSPSIRETSSWCVSVGGGGGLGARAALCWCRCRSRVQRTVGCCVLWHTLVSTCCVSRCSAAHEKNKEPASDVWRLRVRGFCFPAAAASTGKRPHPTAGGPRKQPSAQPLPFFHLRSFWLLNKLWVCKSRQRGVARGRDRRAVASAT